MPTMARPSRIRPALETLMVSGESHAWTLEELKAALARQGVATNFSSVFRAAHQAVEQGLWRKIVLGDGKPRFEPADRHHDHLLCERCGSLEAVACTFTTNLKARIEEKSGYDIRNHSFLWRGLCPRCKQSVPSRRARKPEHQASPPPGHPAAKSPC